MKNTRVYIAGIGLILILSVLLVLLPINGSNTNDIKQVIFGSHFNSAIPRINYTEKTSDGSSVTLKVESSNEDKSIKGKAAKELELNKIAAAGLEVFSDKKSYEILMQKGAKIDPLMAERMQTEKMTAEDREIVNILISELFSEEQNFKVELKQYNGFDELKNAFDKRSKVTGLFYGTDLLKEPMAYKGAKFEDVKKLLDSGASLPDNAIDHMIFAGNIDLAVELKKSGYNVGVNYNDKFRSMNPIEMQAESFAINPYTASLEEQTSTIKQLLDLGASLKVDDGTRDALDIVLGGVNNQNPDQAKVLLGLAKNLHELGIPLEQSHFQLLDEINHKYPDLYNLYARDFR